MNVRFVVIALAAVVLAVAAGFGIATLVLDEPVPASPGTTATSTDSGGPYPTDGEVEIRWPMHRR